MTALLLMISFVLHLITLFTIYQLFKQIQTFKQEKSTAGDIVDLFETYLEEIKAENIRLQRELTRNRSTISDEVASLPETGENEQSSIDLEYEEIPDIDVNDSFEMSLQAKVLQLDGQGFPVEEIAKKLNCGKTEVGLMIKLHAKK